MSVMRGQLQYVKVSSDFLFKVCYQIMDIFDAFKHDVFHE